MIATPKLRQPLTIEQFAAAIEHECCQGSAIDPDLFAVAVEIVPDLVYENSEVIVTPLYDALNWKYTRFGQQARRNLYGAVFRNENSSAHSIKLSEPRIDEKGQLLKYENPKGEGSRAYLARIPAKTWRVVARRYNIDEVEPWLRALEWYKQFQTEKLSDASTQDGDCSTAALAPETTASKSREPAQNSFKGFAANSPKNTPASSSTDLSALAELSLEELRSFVSSLPNRARVPGFWSFVEEHPELEIIFTEGDKKALSLLTLGYIAISLSGVNGGYSKNAINERALIADVERFAVPERSVILAFDQDAAAKTKRRVNTALARFGGLLQQAGCAVSIAFWDGRQGKGIDDLIANVGAAAWEAAYSRALPLEHWRIWQWLNDRLDWQPNLRLQTADLSTLELSDLPEQGIIAVSSAKGTGKTKWTAQQVQGAEAVLSAGHRIALQRNLSQRLLLNYIGDCDKANGEFIAGSAYTLKIGFVVDSLLAIDPEKFRGCDLVLDEVVQVVRHLLASSTCQKDGKRPALLARFKAVIQVARRVIIADADLDKATLHYIRELRGDDEPVFLIRNDYRTEGYPCRFIQSPDRSAIVTELLDEVGTLAPGQALLVCLDNKAVSRTIERLITQNAANVEVWNINSDTSGSEFERAFITNPDPHLIEASRAGKRLVILATPSMGTGVSIEAQDIVQRVYGIFTGVSSTDADMSQALSRVRQLVDRVVWCAKTGSNYSKVSRSTSPLELKRHLQEKTAATVSLIRSSLREDIVGEVNRYDWQADPHVNMYARIAAEQNRSMTRLRDALLVRLKYEGNQITVEELESDPAMRLLLRESRAELRELDAEAIASARVLTLAEKLRLESQESISLEDKRAVERFNLCDFYAIAPDALTTEFVLMDKEGRLRGEIANLEAQLHPDVAADRTVKALEKQASWNQGLCPWDISGAETRRAIREKLGFNDFLDPDKEWTKRDLQPYAERARQFAPAIKAHLHLTISDKMSDVQVVHQLLSQLGMQIEYRSSRSVEGYEGEKLKIYRLNQERWSFLTDVIKRRNSRRKPSELAGSPVMSTTQKQTGEPSTEATESPDFQRFESFSLQNQAGYAFPSHTQRNSTRQDIEPDKAI